MRSQPSRASSQSHAPGLMVGVDVGGTKVSAIVVDADDRPLGRAVRSMTARPAGIEPIVDAIRAAFDAAQEPVTSLSAIGIGVPGRVDADTGAVRLATNLEWENVTLGTLLEAEFGVPCGVENDVRLAAAGLLDHETAGGARSLAYVAIGTGIGAGLILEGRLHRGYRGMAGEIGHVIVQPSGVICPCGQRGCLEAIASGPAIARRAAEAVAEGQRTTLADTRSLTAKAIYDAARGGDALALKIADETGAVIARALAGLVLTCDLERVLLGGGVASAGQVFLRPILAELDRLRADSALVAELVPAGTVQLLPPHFDAVAWGGVALARRTADAISAVGSIANTGPEADDQQEVEEEAVALEEVVARETLA